MWTVQLFIAGYSHPEGTDVEHCDTLEDARHHLLSNHEQAKQYGCGYEPSEMILFRGEYDDVTDMIPDRNMIIGPHGGVQNVIFGDKFYI